MNYKTLFQSIINKIQVSYFKITFLHCCVQSIFIYEPIFTNILLLFLKFFLRICSLLRISKIWNALKSQQFCPVREIESHACFKYFLYGSFGAVRHVGVGRNKHINDHVWMLLFLKFFLLLEHFP